MSTVGNSAAVLPNFLQCSCLVKDDEGYVYYDFGPEAKININNLLHSIEPKTIKRKLTSTPQKGQRRKVKMTVQPLTSTPVKKLN